MSAARISAAAIAEAIGQHPPTPEQRAVIEHTGGSALVVAGAGSGKTETMAFRVLWLLVNGLADPAEILGLSFTRKAAGELSERVRKRYTKLRESSLGSELADRDPFDRPTISTYNSFASQIFRENAALIGRDAEATVLSESSAWLLARRVVIESELPGLSDLDKSLDTITDHVLGLAHQLSDNVADSSDVRRTAREFAALAELPKSAQQKNPYSAALGPALEAVGALPILTELADRFAQVKRERGMIEMSEQMALALQIVDASPATALALREQFPFVLLDEYQDTNVVQTTLLSRLFRENAVMAVGDPNQSIYGWRGASAANMTGFGQEFGSDRHFSLSVSWRNGHGILGVANRIAEPLATGDAVVTLAASPVASAGTVTVLYPDSFVDEAKGIAEWFRQRLEVPEGSEEKPLTAAILCRARAPMRDFVRALRALDIPVHVVGLGGLLEEPEIVDVVATLTVLHRPDAGEQLIRLLSGSRWRIGPRDLRALSDLARELHGKDQAGYDLSPEVNEALRGSVVGDEGVSIVDALDALSLLPAGHHAWRAFSADSQGRLVAAGRFFARLRRRLGLDLLDLVGLVVHELLLDVELLANENRLVDTANLDEFESVVASYLQSDPEPGLAGLLAWLRIAGHKDRLSAAAIDPEPGTVQLLTIHGAKGLEWDLVAVPRLVTDELPGAARDLKGWLSFGQLPWVHRGDAQSLPLLDWRSATTQKEFGDRVDDFGDEIRARNLAEDRRLAYVAVTRARQELLLTGSFWAQQVKPRSPSRFLTELEEAGLIPELPTESTLEANPNADVADLVVWPADPLGDRRPSVERAAASVRAADPAIDLGPWQQDVDALLDERERRREADRRVDLPTRIPASRFKDFVSDPAAVAAQLRRPMPQRPFRQTQLGTVFHSWVEQRASLVGSTESIDAGAFELDLDPTDAGIDVDELQRLKDVFERSDWAEAKPEAVEIEIHYPLAGQIMICKIDAVYPTATGFQIVDWKTGKAPRDAADLEQKQLQLALYRLAFAHWKGIDPDTVDAVFYFVADDKVIRPERLYDESELISLLNRIAP